MSEHDRLTSIVMPVHNQADHIGDVVSSHLDSLRRLGEPFELLLVPNASRDDSAAICARLAEENPEVRAIPEAEPGWGRAVRAGLAAARGQSLCYANSARTTPEILMLMLAYALAYPQVVLKANRRVRDSRRRRFGSVLFNLECRALFDLPIWDINGTPKIFPREFDKLLSLTRDDDLLDVEFAVVCRREGYPMIEVPILATERRGGRSTTNYHAALRLYWGAYRLSKETRVPG